MKTIRIRAMEQAVRHMGIVNNNLRVINSISTHVEHLLLGDLFSGAMDFETKLNKLLQAEREQNKRKENK